MTKIISKEAIKRRSEWVAKIGGLNGDFAANSLLMETDLGTEIAKYGTSTTLRRKF